MADLNIETSKTDNNNCPDETEYLTSSEANRKSLDESIRQLEDGKGVKISIEDLWK